MPVEKARVCLIKDDEGLYLTDLTDHTGEVQFTLNLDLPGPMQLTVSEGHTYHHYRDSVHLPILPHQGEVYACGWGELQPIPQLPSGRTVRRGGWLAADDSGGLFAAKGFKTGDFYRRQESGDTWHPAERIPLGAENREPDEGSRGICDDAGHVYATKGRNSLGFWEYTVAADSWAQLPDVPRGPYNKKVKKGADLAFARFRDSGCVYLLKGDRGEFYRYNTAAQRWDTLLTAPAGVRAKWPRGSWLAHDGDTRLYAHKGKYYNRTTGFHEMWTYEVAGDTWSSTSLKGMPLLGQHGIGVRKKKAADGSAGAWHDGCLFALKGGNSQQFWKYDPAQNEWTELDTVPTNGSTGIKRRVRHGGDVVSVGQALYVLKGNKTREFWGYAEGLPTGTFRSKQGKPTRQGRGPSAAKRMPSTGGVASVAPFTTPGRTRLVMRPVMQEGGADVALPGLVESGGKPAREGRDGGVVCVVDTFFDVLTEDAPDWSPDGQWIASSRFDSQSGWDQLYKKNPWTGGEASILQPEAHCSKPDYSPNGQWVVYEADDPDKPFTQIWMSPAGTVGSPVPLTKADYDHHNPQWAPDGRCVVFEADLPDYTQIHMVAFQQPFVEYAVTRESFDHFNPRPYPTAASTRQPGGVVPVKAWDTVYERDDDDGFTQVCWSQDCGRCLSGDPVAENQLTFREVDHTYPCPPNDSGDVLYQAEDDEYGMEGIWRVRLSDPGVEWLVMFDDTCDFAHPDLSPDGGTAAADKDGYDGSIAVYGEDIYGRASGNLTPADAIRTWPRFSPTTLTPALAVAWEAIAGGGGVQSAGRLPGTGYGFRQASANPATGNVTLSWQLPCAQHVRVAVYDMLGRLVRTVQDGESPAGSGRAVWDRKDERGRRVSAGIYFCELQAGGQAERRKLILVR